MTWRGEEYASSHELIGLGLGLLVTATVAVAAMSLLDLNAVTTVTLLGLGALAIRTWMRLGVFAFGFVDGGSSFIGRFLEAQLTAFEDELIAVIDLLWRGWTEALFIFAVMWGWTRLCRML